jgi:hypothetical protein
MRDAHPGRHRAGPSRAAARRRRRDVDAVIWTHDHADHCHGIDDLRQLYPRPRARRCRLCAAGDAATRCSALRLCLRRQGGYPPVAGQQSCCPTSLGRRHRVRIVDQPHGDDHVSRASASMRRASRSAIPPISTRLPTRWRSCSKASTSGSSMRCAGGRIRRTPHLVAGAGLDRDRAPEARLADAYGPTAMDYRACWPSCRTASSRL